MRSGHQLVSDDANYNQLVPIPRDVNCYVRGHVPMCVCFFRMATLGLCVAQLCNHNCVPDEHGMIMVHSNSAQHFTTIYNCPTIWNPVNVFLSAVFYISLIVC